MFFLSIEISAIQPDFYPPTKQTLTLPPPFKFSLSHSSNDDELTKMNGVNGVTNHLRNRGVKVNGSSDSVTSAEATMTAMNKKKSSFLSDAFFLSWSMEDASDLLRNHPIPCVFALSLLFFMGVEYTLFMIPSSSPPFDLGFIATRSLHQLLSDTPALNTILAALNTVFVLMQTTYILWTFVVEGRPRATIATLFMFTCRGILGYTTQLPLPQEFLGSGADFPVGNVSFFLFFSGHVAGSVIASLDMRRVKRWEMAWFFDLLNLLQVMRLLGTRGHYTIDLAVGWGAGLLFDSLGGKYVESKRKITEVELDPHKG